MAPAGLDHGNPLLFTGPYKRWAKLLVWGSVAASTYIVMIAAGGGLMFRSLGVGLQPAHRLMRAGFGWAYRQNACYGKVPGI